MAGHCVRYCIFRRVSREHVASGAIPCTRRSFLPAKKGGMAMYFLRIVGRSEIIKSARAIVLPRL